MEKRWCGGRKRAGGTILIFGVASANNVLQIVVACLLSPIQAVMVTLAKTL